jgi:hypothetical protein
MRAGIEAAPPFSRIGVVRVAGADRDRADADVAKADLPAFVAGFEIAAAGKDRHGIIEAWPGRAGNGKREVVPARGDTLRPLGVVSRGPRNTGKQYDALHLSPRRPLGCQGPPRGPQLSRIRRLKIPACAECPVVGFCHEVRLRFDSARPTGCAGGLARARRMVVLETHLASGRLVAAGMI